MYKLRIDTCMRIDPNTGFNDAEFIAHSTVRIEVKFANGKSGVGTGFLYEFWSTNQSVVHALVTNKHVLEGAQNASFVFNPTGKDNKIDFNGEKISVKITDFSKYWYGHPDPKIDLAFIPLAPILDNLSKEAKYPFRPTWTRDNFPKVEEWNMLTALEQIVTVGYPDDIWDSTNNLPVLRRGVTATHPKIDYQGKPEFLIDAAVYPGTSGSPVFLYEYKELMLGQELNLGKDKPRLIGILYGVYSHQQQGEMKSIPIPTVRSKIPIMDIPNNLGIVIKSTELDAFIPMIDKKLTKQNLKESALK